MKINIEKLGKVAITVEEDYWSINKSYDRLTIVEEEDTVTTYISRIPVPAGKQLSDRHYWIPIGTRATVVSMSNFILLNSIADLPTTRDEVEGPYVIDGFLYIWVGAGGNIQDGHYQSLQVQGETGNDGLSAYQLYVAHGGTLSEEEWLASLQGRDGADGLSAYELYLKTLAAGDIPLSLGAWLDSLKGEKGDTPKITISTRGTWVIDNVDTGVSAKGVNGTDGVSPMVTIGQNGNWYINGSDTGCPSRGVPGIGAQGPKGEKGEKGENGETPYIKDGYWYVGQENTYVKARGPQGPPGTSGGVGAYIADNKICIPIRSNDVVNIPELITPRNNSVPGTLTKTHPDFNIVVYGQYLTAPLTIVNLTPNKCTISYNNIESTEIVVSAEEVNNNNVTIHGLYTDVNTAMIGSCTIAVMSDELENTVYVNYRYKPLAGNEPTGNTPGTVSPGTVNPGTLEPGFVNPGGSSEQIGN